MLLTFCKHRMQIQVIILQRLKLIWHLNMDGRFIRLVSFWEGLFSEATLVSRRIYLVEVAKPFTVSNQSVRLYERDIY